MRSLVSAGEEGSTDTDSTCNWEGIRPAATHAWVYWGQIVWVGSWTSVELPHTLSSPALILSQESISESHP